MFNGLKLVCVDLSMNIVEYTRLLVFNLVALIILRSGGDYLSLNDNEHTATFVFPPLSLK